MSALEGRKQGFAHASLYPPDQVGDHFLSRLERDLGELIALSASAGPGHDQPRSYTILGGRNYDSFDIGPIFPHMPSGQGERWIDRAPHPGRYFPYGPTYLSRPPCRQDGEIPSAAIGGPLLPEYQKKLGAPRYYGRTPQFQGQNLNATVEDIVITPNPLYLLCSATGRKEHNNLIFPTMEQMFTSFATDTGCKNDFRIFTDNCLNKENVGQSIYPDNMANMWSSTNVSKPECSDHIFDFSRASDFRARDALNSNYECLVRDSDFNYFGKFLDHGISEAHAQREQEPETASAVPALNAHTAIPAFIAPPIPTFFTNPEAYFCQQQIEKSKHERSTTMKHDRARLTASGKDQRDVSKDAAYVTVQSDKLPECELQTGCRFWRPVRMDSPPKPSN